jgi:hypothetical protein
MNLSERLSNEYSENMLLYFLAALRNQNDMHDEVKSLLYSGNNDLHLIQKYLYFRLPFET